MDGHNRYEICGKHSIPFKTIEMEFSSEGKALEWMLKNQQGRRNLSDYARGTVALLVKSVLEKEARERQLSTLKQNGSSDVEIFPQREDEGRTRDKLGELAGVSGKTIDKIEYIETHAPEDAKQALRTGAPGVSISKVYEATKEEETYPIMQR